MVQVDFSKLKAVEGFQWSPELKTLYNLLENSYDNIFLTGNAGSGKTAIIKVFLKNTKKNYVVVAPTGVAAVNAGGTTIHSFFKLPPKIITRQDIDTSAPVVNVDKVDVLIIDEVSMVRADIFDAIDFSMRKTGRYPDQPFGGAKVIIIGDLYQIPPIVTENEKHAFAYLYKSPFFFSSNAFKKGNFRHVELKKVYRQKDPRFVEILNRIRLGEIHQSDIDDLNKTVGKVRESGDNFVTLTTTKLAAGQINYDNLSKLPGDTFRYESTVAGTFKKENCVADDILFLKEGAQVMMCRNDSVDGRWVNGTLGKVVYLDEDKIKVELRNVRTGYLEVVSVERATWENIKYEWNPKTEKHEHIVIGTMEQFPVKLAYAMTIHKSQGSTFDNVDIDTGTGAFASGQTYVALSRCTTLDGIRLRRKIRHEDIIVDPIISKFFKYLERKRLEEDTL